MLCGKILYPALSDKSIDGDFNVLIEVNTKENDSLSAEGI